MVAKKTEKVQMSDVEIVAHVEAWSTAPKGMPLNHRLYYYNSQKGWVYLRREGRDVYAAHKVEVDELLRVHRQAVEAWAEKTAEEVLSV